MNRLVFQVHLLPPFSFPLLLKKTNSQPKPPAVQQRGYSISAGQQMSLTVGSHYVMKKRFHQKSSKNKDAADHLRKNTLTVQKMLFQQGLVSEEFSK